MRLDETQVFYSSQYFPYIIMYLWGNHTRCFRVYSLVRNGVIISCEISHSSAATTGICSTLTNIFSTKIRHIHLGLRINIFTINSPWLQPATHCWYNHRFYYWGSYLIYWWQGIKRRGGWKRVRVGDWLTDVLIWWVNEWMSREPRRWVSELVSE
jgi:hypothetical protein